MKKKAVALSLAALLLFSLAGCSKADDGGAEAAPVESPAASDAAAASLDLQMLTTYLFSYNCGAMTEDGYYYIQPNAADYLTGQIRYIDYASGLDIPLSSQVNSTHTTEEDTSYLDSIIGDYRLFIWNNQLYFLRMGASYYMDNSDFGALAAGAIYRMNLDGSDRQLVYQSDSSADLVMQVAGGGDSLYFIRQTTDAYQVMKVPATGGDAVQVAEYPVENFIEMVGCAGNEIYFRECVVDIPVGDEIPGATHLLKALDVTTGQTREVLSLSPDTAQYASPFVENGKLYLFYAISNFPKDNPQYVEPDYRLDVCSLDGTVEKTIDFAAALDGILENCESFEANYLDGSVVISYWRRDAKVGASVLVDTATGAVTTSAATLVRDDGKDTRAARFVAENGQYYLAAVQNKMEDAAMPQGDGTSITVQSSRYVYQILPKSSPESDSPEARTVEYVE